MEERGEWEGNRKYELPSSKTKENWNPDFPQKSNRINSGRWKRCHKQQPLKKGTGDSRYTVYSQDICPCPPEQAYFPMAIF